jgi:hypothetical protein
VRKDGAGNLGTDRLMAEQDNPPLCNMTAETARNAQAAIVESLSERGFGPVEIAMIAAAIFIDILPKIDPVKRETFLRAHARAVRDQLLGWDD